MDIFFSYEQTTQDGSNEYPPFLTAIERRKSY